MLELSTQSRIDFPSRISARAVVVGAMAVFVSFNALFALGGALGLVPAGALVDANAIREAGAGLAVWGTLSLIGGAFAGAFLSAVSARATSPGDGLLQGVATWAVATVVATVLSRVSLMWAISLDLVDRDIIFALSTRAAYSTYFIADLLALGAALMGGRLGATRQPATPAACG